MCTAPTRYEKGSRILRTPHFEVHNVPEFSQPIDVLRQLLAQSRPGSKEKSDGQWAEALLSTSSQVDSVPGALLEQLNPRGSIVVAGLFQAALVLAKTGILQSGDTSAQENENNKKQLAAGLKLCMSQLLEMLKKHSTSSNGGLPSETDIINDSNLPSYFMLQVAISLDARRQLIERFEFPDDEFANDALNLKKVLLAYFIRQFDRLMARSHVISDPYRDQTSLAFVLCGWSILDPTSARTSLFAAGIEAVVNAQRDDGRWPEGISISTSPSGDTVQQPSVDIAIRLAESALDPTILLQPSPAQIEMIKTALKAMRKMAKFLSESFRNGGDLLGWDSDRTRRPDRVEMWVTAMAARLFHLAWIYTRAYNRAELLSKYGVTFVTSELPSVAIDKRWASAITEPDSVLKPAELILDYILAPIDDQVKKGHLFLMPKEDGVSYIVFGPPGSGKTYFIKMIANVLGWPLLTLNPGHFIKAGLENIEATSAQLFADLMQLDHVIVFFDECDELFRERSTKEPADRNILSFATASMLPKLQDLHDLQRVIFFLGTNFLSNVDRAIRRPGRFDHILLYDRPDEHARESLLRQFYKPELLQQKSAEEVAQEIAATAGYMVSEIKAYVKAKNQKPHISVDDYIDWCDQHGKQELNSSRIPESLRSEIMRRWSVLGNRKLNLWQTIQSL